MKKISLFVAVVFFITGLSFPCFAQEKTYRIEVLQVTNIEPFDQSYNGFFKELEKNGIAVGQNLTVNRRIIDFDVEKGGLWKKVGVLFRIKKEASKIVDANPDLVLTIGTPATKYAKDKIISAGIPLVFTGVAIPEAAGCKSMTESGPGFTGATLYTDMKDALQILRLAFPQLKTLGIVHTDDDNAVAQVEEVKAKGPAAGITVINKEVSKRDKVTPAVEELINQGAEGFAIPLDTYYAMRDYEPSKDLAGICLKHKLPGISLALVKTPGAIIYVGADFMVIGAYSGGHAAKILKGEAMPGDLPVLRQEELKIMVDTKQMQALGIQLPMEILQLAKSIQ